MEQEKLRVLIFHPNEYHLGRTKETVQESKWLPMPYDDIDAAIEDFDEQVGALITTLLHKKDVLASEDFPAMELIALSNGLHVPRAMISHSKGAQRFVRNESDIVIPPNLSVQNKIAKWLKYLRPSSDEDEL